MTPEDFEDRLSQLEDEAYNTYLHRSAVLREELLAAYRQKCEDSEWVEKLKITSVEFGHIAYGPTGAVSFDFDNENWEAVVFVNDDPATIAAKATGPTIPSAIKAALEKMN